ncbi:MAG: hypothetical protein JWM86_1263 [Thermoleophilia bacterium]|nr:hypothetical protein [Thermoleophilia bacterium]
MQVATAGTVPAREVLRAHLPAGDIGPVPDAFFDARIGRGTVASEFNRTISVRLDGSGPPSRRALIPQTPATEQLLASPAGPAFERLVRSTMAAGDAARGHENLRSLTFLPDEHAMKAVDVLTQLAFTVRATGTAPSLPKDPAAARAAAALYARSVAEDSIKYNATSLAWNADGEMVVMPDVTRRLFATIDAYRPSKGDRIVERTKPQRDYTIRDDFDTLVHEAHHSVSPEPMQSSDSTSAWEEAISSVFGLQDRARAARATGANVIGVIEDPTSAHDGSGLGWGAWNRDRLPKPTKAEQEQTKVTYQDGPRVVRELLGLAGIDRRTTAGRATTLELLQGRSARFAPRRVADAIIAARGLDPGVREGLVRRVRESVNHPDGVGHVTELLDTLRPAAT